MFYRARKDIVFPQWYAGIGVTLLIVQLGLMSGWASPVLARLTTADSEIPLSPEQASWVASLLNLGRLAGAILGAVTTDYLGSKRAILASLLPTALGWLGIVFADTVVWLYAARLLNGLGLGMAFSTFPLFIGEVSMPEIRGALISLGMCGGSLGQIIASLCGSYLGLSASSSLYLLLCLGLAVLFLYLPDTPHYLAKVGQREAARSSIDWYRAGRGVDEELQAVEKFVATSGSECFADRLREFRKPYIRRATFQIIALFTFMQISGLNSLIFYMEIILKRANFVLISPSLVVVCVNVCGFLMAAVSIVLIDRCGRRFLLLVSSVGISLSMFGLMCHFRLVDSGADTSGMQWLPMGCMFFFMISFFVGMLPVPSTTLSELFPANVKSLAACISGLTSAVMAFVSAKTYQPLVNLIGESYVFMIYAICALAVIPYVLLFMPETKGKSLQQIQDVLENKKGVV